MDDFLPAVGPMTAAWVDFFIMVGVFAVIALGGLIWVFYLRKKKRKHRHKRHRRERRLANPTLAQTGGLPPTRPPEPPEATPSASETP